MTGWRVGMAVGNAEMINALLIIKSNLDSGVPQAIQEMGIEALETTDDWLDGRNAIYQNRRDKVLRALETIGLHVDPPKASLYVWARVPEGETSASFTEKILDECAIVVTPGSGYGQYGEGYIRLSLTIGDADLDRGLERLVNWSAK